MEKLQTIMKNLTLDESINRSKVIMSPVSYFLFLKEEKNKRHYEGIVKISFMLKSLPLTILIDFKGSKVNEIKVNGATLFQPLNENYKNFWNGYNILIPQDYLLFGANELIIDFENFYSKDGFGFHSFVDEDGKQYNYTDLEPDHCCKWFPCFDQPDIKGTFNLLVILPIEWVAISNEIVQAAEVIMKKSYLICLLITI